MAANGSDVWGRYGKWLLSAIAVLCALALHYVDTHTDDTQFAFFTLVGFSFILGAVQPARAWLNALIIGMGVALPQLLSAAGLYAMPYVASVPGAFVILGIGLLAGYVGAFARRNLPAPRESRKP